jgi:multiple sugar transport system substrate-binding protein
LLRQAGDAVPRTLTQVLDYAQDRPIALALSVPHAFMNHLSLCALMGAEISGDEEVLLDIEWSIEAINLQRQLVQSVPAAAFEWSSIRMLDAMAKSTNLAYCPFVFCFNSYSRPDRTTEGKQLRFASPPDLSAGQLRGPVVGGAGLAVSARCAHRESALRAVAHLMRVDSQRRMAIAGGQVGRASAWADPKADSANGGFFSDCRAAVEAAKVRPRHRGYIGFQNAAGAVLGQAMRTAAEPSRSVALRLQELYSQWWEQRSRRTPGRA